MGFIKKYRFQIGFLAFLVAVFFFSRLYQIDKFPIFTDEAIYVRWSQIARFDANWRFISLTDGKQPSFVWIAFNMMRVVQDPLLAGRLVSVVAGFASMIGLFFLGREVFKNSLVGLVSSALYIVFPMALVYDRMALYDSLVGAFTIWSLYLAILLVRHVRLDTALILGMVIGGGVLTKTSAFFNIYLLPFTLLLFDWKNKKRLKRLLLWVGLATLSTILAYGYYSILRLSPFYHIINDKNTVFVYPLHDWIKHPFEFFYGNLQGVWDWYLTYSTWPFVLLTIASFVVQRKFFWEKLLLVIWFLLPFVALALFGRVLYPRFIFFMTLTLLPLIAYSLVVLWSLIRKRMIFAVFVILVLFLPIRSDYLILTNFAKAPIPQSDLGQYINDWPAGGGVKEITSFLKEKANKQKIFVATEGTFGSLSTYAVEIYLGDNKNVEKRGFWPVTPEIPKDLQEKAKTMSVYVVFNETQNPPSWPLRFITRYQKGTGNSYISLYEVEKR